jgi:transposase-like protein
MPHGRQKEERRMFERLAAMKLIWLSIRNKTAKLKSPPIQWHAAKAAFAVQFEDQGRACLL